MRQKQAKETEVNCIRKLKDSLYKGKAIYTWMNLPLTLEIILVSVDVHGVKEAITEVRHMTFDFVGTLRWNMSLAAEQVRLSCSLRMTAIEPKNDTIIDLFQNFKHKQSAFHFNQEVSAWDGSKEEIAQ